MEYKIFPLLIRVFVVEVKKCAKNVKKDKKFLKKLLTGVGSV